MNCQQTRNRLLALEEPADVPGELAAHLDACAECRSWHRLFVGMDEALTRLPVPVADGTGKLAVLEKIRATPAPAKPAPAKKSRPAAQTNHKPAPAPAAKPMPLNLEDDLPKKKRSLGRLAAQFWPAGLVAATLLVGVVAWLSLRGGKPKPADALPADPFLDGLVRHNVELAKTQTPEQRVAVLAKVADDINREMRDIARADATGEDMQALAEMYRKVVQNGLIAQAKQVKSPQREAVLAKVADGLAQAGQKAEQTAAEAPQHSAERLREAAEAAREGTKVIRNLLKEA
jgi:hypothetical protein